MDRLLEDFLFERLHKTKNNGFGGNEAKDVAFELAEELAPLVQLATGTNPRSFKRYLNILDLLTCVEYARGDGTTPWTKRSKIFCRTLLVALQVGWEDVANYLDTCESHDEYVKVLQTLRGFDANNVLDFKKQEDEDIDAGLVELLEAEYAPSAGKTEPDKWLANPAIERLGTFGSELFDLLDENHDGDLDESELDTFITVTEELSLTSVNRNQKLTGWHKFRHNLRENSSGDRRTRTGTARRYRRLARKLYDKRKPGVVSIGRFDNRFTVKLQFNGQRTVVELKDEFVIKIRERNDPASDGSLDIPASYSDLVAEFVERSTMEADLPWNRTSWSNTQYWELNFDDLKPTKKQYKCLEEGLTDLVHRGTKIAQKLTTQQQPNAKSAVVEGVGATASS